MNSNRPRRTLNCLFLYFKAPRSRGDDEQRCAQQQWGDVGESRHAQKQGLKRCKDEGCWDERTGAIGGNSCFDKAVARRIDGPGDGRSGAGCSGKSRCSEGRRWARLQREVAAPLARAFPVADSPALTQGWHVGHGPAGKVFVSIAFEKVNIRF